MSINNLKQNQSQKQFKTNIATTPVTNPLNAGFDEYQSLQKLNNKRIILDRIMFVALGAFAVWAFYSALLSLML